MKTSVNNFGKNLRYYRKQKGLNQSQLGKLVGVGQTTVANYEKGIREPSIQIIEGMTSVLGVSVEDLLSDGHVGKGSELLQDKEQLIASLLDILLKRADGDAKTLIASLSPDCENFSEIVDEIITPTMYRIGGLWAAKEISVAEEHAATETAMGLVDWMTNEIRPLPDNGIKVVSVVYTTEFHTLGMKMVASFLKVRGFKSLYLGNNLTKEHLSEYLHKEKPDVLLLSVTLSYQLNGTRNMIEAIRKNPEFNDMSIIIGGQGTSYLILDDEGVDTYQGNLVELESWIKEIKHQ